MKRCILFLSLAAVSAPSISAQQMVVSGPFGVPLQVEDEAGGWSIPITVYEDRDVAMLIQDVTSQGWIQWNSGGYLKTGKFWVDLYSFFKTDYLCLNTIIPLENRQNPQAKEVCRSIRYEKKMIVVDTREQTVSVPLRVLISPSGDPQIAGLTGSKKELPITAEFLGPRTDKAIKRIILLVDKECRDQL
jgi:hypothetical protein